MNSYRSNFRKNSIFTPYIGKSFTHLGKFGLRSGLSGNIIKTLHSVEDGCTPDLVQCKCRLKVLLVEFESTALILGMPKYSRSKDVLGSFAINLNLPTCLPYK